MNELDDIHEEAALGRAVDRRLMMRLWRYVAPYGWQVVLTLSLVFPLFLLELAPAWIIKHGLDRVIRPAEGVASAIGPDWIEGMLDPPGSVEALTWLGSLYLVALLGLAALQFTNMVLMAWTGQSAMRDLRREVFAHIQKLHLGFFDRYPVGRLVTRATNDVENVAEMFSAGIVALVTDVIKMIGFAVMLFLVEWRLALVTFLVVPFLALAAIIFRLQVREAFRDTRIRIARINTQIQETITGMKVVQLFTREARNMRDFDEMNAAHRDAWHRSIRWDAALFAVVEVASRITVAIVIAYSVGLVAAGTIYLFMDWMRRFFMPLRDLSAKYSVMQSSMASAERIFQLLDTEPEVVDRPAASGLTTFPTRRGVVEFQNVWFAYQNEEWVLRDLSFRVEPGDRVALVGATGAGKTSVIKLLSRLYEPQRGRILIDGVDLRDLPQAEVRRRIGLVLQDVFLFTGTISENIGLGRSDIDRAAIEQAARIVEAERFILRLPEGYATPIRERGSNLSAGQAQLLAFARALAHGADVLVLDEATSSIDTETEELIQRGIHALMARKTAIVIAHRLSTIQDVDRIFVMHRGRIVEHGSHEDLIAHRGTYYRLYQLQYRATDAATATRAAV